MSCGIGKNHIPKLQERSQPLKSMQEHSSHQHNIIKKKALLEQWYSVFLETSLIKVLSCQEEFVLDKALKNISKSQISLSDEEAIYTLFIKAEEGNFIPVYVGKSNSILTRWKSHLKKLQKGDDSYKRWKSLLIDNDNRAIYDTFVVIILGSHIDKSPLPEFPTTVGSVEYQLVSLVSDAYPEYLLNHEGNRR